MDLRAADFRALLGVVGFSSASTSAIAAAQALEYAASHEEVSKQIRCRINEQNLSASLQIQEVIRIEHYLQKLYKWHSQEDGIALVNALLNPATPNDAPKLAALRSKREISI